MYIYIYTNITICINSNPFISIEIMFLTYWVRHRHQHPHRPKSSPPSVSFTEIIDPPGIGSWRWTQCRSSKKWLDPRWPPLLHSNAMPHASTLLMEISGIKEVTVQPDLHTSSTQFWNDATMCSCWHRQWLFSSCFLTSQNTEHPPLLFRELYGCSTGCAQVSLARSPQN